MAPSPPVAGILYSSSSPLRFGSPSMALPQRAESPVTAPASFRIELLGCIEFLRELPDECVDVIVTDPAYSGMNQHLQLGRGRIVGRYQAEDNGQWFREFHDDPANYRRFLGECRRVLREDRHVYIMFDSFSLLTLGPLVREFFEVKNVIIWDKVRLGMGHYFRRRHEHIVFASKGHRKLTRRDLADIWAIPRLMRAPYPAQKPVELFDRMLCGSAEAGFVVCDPFVGSGSSAIASLRRGCHFLGADISAGAVRMARQRCERFLAVGVDELEARGECQGAGRRASNPGNAG
jgi:site-specific DNA-methyltransferase (adenine-specific)